MSWKRYAPYAKKEDKEKVPWHSRMNHGATRGHRVRRTACGRCYDEPVTLNPCDQNIVAIHLQVRNVASFKKNRVKQVCDEDGVSHRKADQTLDLLNNSQIR